MCRHTVRNAIISILALQGALSAQQSKQPRPITEAERTYLGAAASYLRTANTQGTKVAQTMAAGSNGSSTLGDIKTAFSSAKRVESAAYDGDYRVRIAGNVPGSFADIAKNIDETHRLFQAAMGEYLEYWKDQNTAHIVSGKRTLKRCIILMNATIAATTAKTRELKAK
jgi:type II secretory pathway pseudopilin PulG